MSLRLIVELEQVLDSKGKLSKWEEELFNSFKLTTVTDFFKGAVGSMTVVWPAFWAIPTISRLTLSTIAGLAGGRWNCGRTIDATVDRFLGLQGTRVQTELASLILREYKDDTSLVMLVRKHFYSEQVFGDVNSEVPLFRWRPRNTYIDSSASQNRTTEKSDNTRSDYSGNSGLPEKHNATDNQNWDLFVDPLESIFGYTDDSTETQLTRQSEAAEVLSRRQLRALKRAHRRQRSNNAALS